MAAQAKEMRDEWEVKLYKAIEELNIATEADPVNKRVIIGKVNKVKSTSEKLERAHSQYCLKAKVGFGSNDSTAYLRTMAKLEMTRQLGRWW